MSRWVILLPFEVVLVYHKNQWRYAVVYDNIYFKSIMSARLKMICCIISKCNPLLVHTSSWLWHFIDMSGVGQTCKTTAIFLPWNDDCYFVLESTHWFAVSKIVGHSHRVAIDTMEKSAKEENISCQFKIVPAYLFVHDDEKSTLDILLEVLDEDPMKTLKRP